jgi:hypothetical protein
VLSEKQTHKHTACDSIDRNVQDRTQGQEVDLWARGWREARMTDDGWGWVCLILTRERDLRRGLHSLL